MRIIFLLLICYSASAFSSDALKDLEFYSKEGDFKEFFIAWKRLPPSERGGDGALLLMQTSERYLKELISKQDYAQLHFDNLLGVGGQKTLQDDFVFWDRFATYLLPFFKYKILKEGDESLSSLLEKLALVKPQFKALSGTKLYEYISEQNFTGELLPIFSSLLEVSEGAKLCVDSSLMDEIFDEAQAKNRNLKLETAPFSKECLLNFEKIIRTQIFLRPLDEGTMIFTYLQERELLGDLGPSFLFYYFLQAGPAGELLNDAFTMLKKNRETFSEREKLLKKMEELSPMPAVIFSLPDLFKRKTLTTYLEENFPEYRARLKELCNEYKENSKKFKSVPVLSCDLVQTLDFKTKNSNSISN